MKKGFTLIELLAVIIILAILALIVSPIISGVISDAKDASNKRSVEGLSKSAEYYVMKNKYAKEEVSEENIYDELTFSGKKPDSAEVYTKNNKVAVAAIFDDRCYYKNYDSNEVKSAKLSESRVCTINGAETDESCFTYNLINNDTNVEITDYICSYETPEVSYKKTNTDFILEITNPYNLTEDEIITDVVIPNKIDNKEVTSIAASSFRSNVLTSVVIPDSITTIGDYAFSYNNLTSVVIGNSVTTIGNDAFYNNNLTSVVIPNSVTSIGDSAFRCNNLTSVVIGNSVTSIGDEAFYKDLYSNKNLTTITNKTGKSFDWGKIVNDSTGYNFTTGTVENDAGNVTIN